jgi:transcription elongation GreA/GreB family factor
MLKFFLVGWVCIGVGLDKQCVRMGSEVIFNNYQECDEYFRLVKEDLSDVKDTELKFTCVQAGVLEDVL